MPDNQREYGNWSNEELLNAEATARQFLEDNGGQIADTMRAKMRFLEILIQRIEQRKLDFQERLEYMARISEIAKLIQDDADGFFELASQPVVARILSGVRPK